MYIFILNMFFKLLIIHYSLVKLIIYLPYLDIFNEDLLHLIKFFWPGMIGIDSDGNIGAGTSTNGAIHKIPGYLNTYTLIILLC